MTQADTKYVLSVENLNLKVANQQLFQGLSFNIKSRGITALMGPVGIGKSSLLAWLNGSFDPMLFDASWDEVNYRHAVLAEGNHPALFRQKASTSLADAMQLIDELLEDDPKLFCIDEVTARLRPEDAETVLKRLAEIAEDRAVLMVSHNQLQVASYARSVLLLAGGVTQEHTAAKSFFVMPHSDVGRQFLRTGGAIVARAGTLPSHLSSDLREVPEDLQINYDIGNDNSNFRWAIENKLGVYLPTDGQNVTTSDVSALTEAMDGCILFTSQNKPATLEVLREAGVDAMWYPMSEQEVISVEDCRGLCRELQRQLDSDEQVLIVHRPTNHIAARTVATQLVFMGLAAGKAAEVAQSLIGNAPLGLNDEQLLWDFELSNDLAENNVDHPIPHAINDATYEVVASYTQNGTSR